jgi:hypothetical protein
MVSEGDDVPDEVWDRFARRRSAEGRRPWVVGVVAASINGKMAGLYLGDFTFGDLTDRRKMIDAAAAQSKADALVTLKWHMCPPTVSEPRYWNMDAVRLDSWMAASRATARIAT